MDNRVDPTARACFSLFGELDDCYDRVQVLKELEDDMDYSTDTQNGIAIMRLAGRIDAHTAGPLDKWISEQCDQTAPVLLINFEDATFIDTYAISLLIKGLKRCNQQGTQLVLCNLAQPVQIIFELMRLDRAFKVFESEASAMGALEAVA